MKIDRAAITDRESPQSAGRASAGWQKWILLAAFALIVIFRLPEAWTHGRFLDEEATVFLAYAWHFPIAEAFFRPFGGYWNLGANASTVAAVQLIRTGWLDLERAPYFTMGIALAVQLLPALLIVTGRAPWLVSRWAVMAALLVIAIMPATEEVFFNVLHIQFHLALCAALILALDIPVQLPVRVGYGALLFLGPLCGPGAIILLPLFALRALMDRDRLRAWQLAAVGCGAAVQLLFFYGGSSIRGPSIDLISALAAMFIRLIALPVAGLDFANRTGLGLVYQTFGKAHLWLCAGAAVILLGAFLAFASQRRDSGLWFALSGLALAVVTFGFGFASADPNALFFPTAGERYNFLPLVLLGLALIVMATREGFQGKRAYVALCILLLFNGTYRYPQPLEQFARGPSWPKEVQAWRADHGHQLAVWPRPWTADLSDEPRRCSPITEDVIRSTDPRYCESGWMAAFYRVDWAIGAVRHPKSRP